MLIDNFYIKSAPMNGLSRLFKSVKFLFLKMVEGESRIGTKILDPPADVKKMKQWNPGKIWRNVISCRI